MNTVQICDKENYVVGGGNPLLLLAGPCVLEGFERCLMIGRTIKEITERLGIPWS